MCQFKDQEASQILPSHLSRAQVRSAPAMVKIYHCEESGGKQRRVALARSFATQPQLLILDEPFTSLDEPVANLLREMLLKLWIKQPTTIIFVTHDINEAIYLSDKIVFLSKPPSKVIKEININTKRPRKMD